jgi:hypothetical protein
MESFELNTENLEFFDFKSQIHNIFDENGYIVFLLDRTLKDYVFDEWINDVKKKNIEFIPFGISRSEPHLFFLLIDNKAELEKRVDEFSEYLKSNLIEKSNEFYLYGFGVINDDLSIIANKFKKKLKLADSENTFLFRWYDPRVAVYLHTIFESERVNDLFSIFKFWVFTHSSGIYTYKNDKSKKSFFRKIGLKESKKLDLIEISNFIFFNLINNMEEIDHLEIFKSLQMAVNEKGLSQYKDIYLYGHYSCVIGQNFLDHDILKNKRQQYESFEKLIESVLDEEWLKIKNDLGRVNYVN